MKTKDQKYCNVREDKIKKANPVVDKHYFKLYVSFIKERHVVYKRRLSGQQPPFSDDVVMQNNRFCNVKRELDRQSKWLIEHISTNKNLSYENKIYNTIFYRLYNLIRTAEELKLPIDFKNYDINNFNDFRKKVTEDKEFYPYTMAYCTFGVKGNGKDYRPNEAPLFIMEKLLNSKFLETLNNCENQKEVFKCIKKYVFGAGNFLAYQLYVDLTYIKEFPFTEDEFVVSGPGCTYGLSMFIKDRKGLTDEELLFWLRDNWDDLIKKYKIDFDCEEIFSDQPKKKRKMNVMSLENCCCEFQKYKRLTEGQRCKRKFTC